MDLNVHKPKDDDLEIMEPQELLEDSWFFGNLLQRKSRMLRSFSDPCTSSNYRQEILSEKSYEEIYASIKNLSNTAATKGSDSRRSTSNKKTSSNGLVRAPSLPTSLETEELLDEELEFSMGKLIRQASLNYSDKLPPRQHPAKVLTPSPSISRQRSSKKHELEGIKMVGSEERRLQRPMNQLKTQKSLNHLESEELQGFKDLGFDLDKKDSTPDVISIIPGPQEEKIIEEDGKPSRQRPPPYLSETWAAQSGAPPVPKWGGKRSTEDMKAQIKFWARAVASNVRQEC
ncbi:hypothetical protein CDL12_23905 [Handroanthus impetiginosus]|uniref:Uncharacterized protein n=1 Tax=Handroanthus impetiginosus TaxID=429701 RepID=A0A2G9GE61_9LAMI|nr:hypothetical protein CDL12_23905 [Handroanthus impetiginosus]